MSALKRQLLRGLCALVLLAPAAACVCAERPAEGAYGAWMKRLAHDAEMRPGAADAAIAAALLQHLCASDSTCFPDATWRALDARAQHSDNPTVLTLAAVVASYRTGATDLAQRWSHIAAIDRDNAYPLILQAAAEWHAERHEQALETLKSALARPRDDDQFGAAFRLLRPAIDAAPPSLEQLPPCTLAARETPDAPSVAEVRALVLFEIVSDAAFPNHLGYVNPLCKDASAEETERRATCSAIGEHLAAHAT